LGFSEWLPAAQKWIPGSWVAVLKSDLFTFRLTVNPLSFRSDLCARNPEKQWALRQSFVRKHVPPQTIPFSRARRAKRRNIAPAPLRYRLPPNSWITPRCRKPGSRPTYCDVCIIGTDSFQTHAASLQAISLISASIESSKVMRYSLVQNQMQAARGLSLTSAAS
jgi:hypothetical protein